MSIDITGFKPNHLSSLAIKAIGDVGRPECIHSDRISQDFLAKEVA